MNEDQDNESQDKDQDIAFHSHHPSDNDEAIDLGELFTSAMYAVYPLLAAHRASRVETKDNNGLTTKNSLSNVLLGSAFWSTLFLFVAGVILFVGAVVGFFALAVVAVAVATFLVMFAAKYTYSWLKAIWNGSWLDKCLGVPGLALIGLGLLSSVIAVSLLLSGMMAPFAAIILGGSSFALLLTIAIPVAMVLVGASCLALTKPGRDYLHFTLANRKSHVLAVALAGLVGAGLFTFMLLTGAWVMPLGSAMLIGAGITLGAAVTMLAVMLAVKFVADNYVYSIAGARQLRTPGNITTSVINRSTWSLGRQLGTANQDVFSDRYEYRSSGDEDDGNESVMKDDAKQHILGTAKFALLDWLRGVETGRSAYEVAAENADMQEAEEADAALSAIEGYAAGRNFVNTLLNNSE